MTIGEALAAARHDAGRTVEDIARATRIRGQLIRQIEADEFAACGGAVYARGHIRAIATQVGLDPAPLVAEFDRAHDVEGPAPREIFEHEVIAKPERTGPNWTAAMAVMAAVLLVVALGSLFSSKKAGTGALADIPSPSSAPSAAPTAPASQAPDVVAGNFPLNSVTMRIRAVGGQSWVGVTADGKVVYQQLLRDGEQKDFRAGRKIHVVIGNAGAVQLVVNGRSLGSPGTRGQVVRLDFGPGDPAATG